MKRQLKLSYLGRNEDAEMEARQRISNASYSPEALKVLCQAFDEAWEDIGGNFGGNVLAVRAARLKQYHAGLGCY